MRKPIRPRAGTRYSIRAQPVPWFTICCIRPLRSASSWVTTPTYSSGTSIATRSTGSCFLPSISRTSTSGLPIVSSNPSRRMISASTASCSSPRPCTSQASGRTRGEDAQRDVADELLVEPLLDQACGQLVALGAGERRGVDPDRDREARLVDRGHGERARVDGVGDRLADRHLGQAGECDDLAGAGFLGGHAVERLGDEELRHSGVLDLAVRAAPGDLLPFSERAVADPEQCEATDVRRGVEVRDERLQRVVRVVRRRRDRLEDRLEQRARDRRRARPGRAPALAVARDRVDDRELDLRTRSRRGRGRARRPRSRPPRPARPAGRPC